MECTLAEPLLVTFAWLLLGLVAGGAFLAYSKSFGRARRKLLANALVIAAVIYVGFAALGGLPVWVLFESLGVVIFAFIAWLGLHRSTTWLAIGWAVHPA
jgi:hypothetical protein